MPSPRKALVVSFALVAFGTWISAVAISRGEEAPVKALSGAKAIPATENSCPGLRIGFNLRIRYVSHFPINGGREVLIRLTTIDPIEMPKEFTSPPKIPGVDIQGISFEANGSGPVLVVTFEEPVNYSVRQGSDTSGIYMRIAGPDASEPCRASMDLRQSAPSDAGAAKSREDKMGARKRAVSETTADETGTGGADIEKEMAEARAAIAKKEYSRAAQLLTKLIGMPAHKYSAEAQELLGVVRERNGQMAHAKAEYEIYLEKFPDGEGAGRVRQRLAAIETAEAEPPAKLRSASRETATAPSEGAASGGEADASSQASSSGSFVVVHGEEEEPPKDPKAYETSVSGSISTFYTYNQQTTRFEELESRVKTEDDEILQNSLITSLDVIATAENDAFRFKTRFSGSHEADFAEEDFKRWRLSAAYVEAEAKEPGVTARIGRQKTFHGGVQGRFDGAKLSWDMMEDVRLNLVGGVPVDSSRDMPFDNDRWFTGTSVDFTDIYRNWDLSLYALEQRSGSYVDRRALGAEIGYKSDNLWINGIFDYDIHLNRVGLARLTGTRTFEDQSSITLGFDYVTSPVLTLSNALSGQAVDSLSALGALYTITEIEELARDRTTRFWSATGAYSRPLNDMWQVTLDGSIYYTYGNPASGGVPATEAPGLEYYTSLQFTGTGLFKENDIFTATARYANTFSTDLYLFDTSLRYPVSRKFRVRPRLRAGYRDLKRADGYEIFALPSMTFDYKFSKTVTLDMEVGGRFSNRKTSTTAEQTSELFVFGGLRKDF